MFKALYDLVEHDLPCGPKLSKLNTCMIFFLLKVHLNLHFDDITFRFNLTSVLQVYLKIKLFSNSQCILNLFLDEIHVINCNYSHEIKIYYIKIFTNWLLLFFGFSGLRYFQAARMMSRNVRIA